MNNNWVASIDFGNGNCDQWAIKTWNVNVFPENSEGESQFSVFKFNKNKKQLVIERLFTIVAIYPCVQNRVTAQNSMHYRKIQ